MVNLTEWGGEVPLIYDIMLRGGRGGWVLVWKMIETSGLLVAERDLIHWYGNIKAAGLGRVSPVGTLFFSHNEFPGRQRASTRCFITRREFIFRVAKSTSRN